MQSFNEYNETQRHIEALLVDLLAITESDIDFDEDDMLTEGVLDNFAAKLGLKIHRGDSGLIQQFKRAGKAIFKLFMAAIKGDKATVKEVAGSLKREDVAKFIFNLDNATLHILAIPIHTINAITGWDIEPASTVKKAKHMGTVIRTEIERIRDLIKDYFDPKQSKTFIELLNNIYNQVPAK